MPRLEETSKCSFVYNVYLPCGPQQFCTSALGWCDADAHAREASLQGHAIAVPADVKKHRLDQGAHVKLLHGLRALHLQYNDNHV